MINGYYLRNRFVVVYNKAIIIIINKILRYLLAVVKHYLQTFDAKSKLPLLRSHSRVNIFVGDSHMFDGTLARLVHFTSRYYHIYVMTFCFISRKSSCAYICTSPSFSQNLVQPNFHQSHFPLSPNLKSFFQYRYFSDIAIGT